MYIETGQRVAHIDGNIGYVTNEHGDNNECFTDVRWLTPNNTPSCSTSLCSNDSLTIVSDSVVPMQRNEEWWAESNALKAEIEAALDGT